MDNLQVSVAGGSGYAGGELLRLLTDHPGVEVQQVTSQQHVGHPVAQVHPNLRRRVRLNFSALVDLRPCDLLFLCLPHGESMGRVRELSNLAPKLVDLSADFRLHRADDYRRWYGVEHTAPDLLDRFVYGIPEWHRERIAASPWVSSAGCNATAAILALRPLYRAGVVDPGHTVVDIKAGTSEGGNRVSDSTHHPLRAHSLRSYKPTGHRHAAEVIQELGEGNPIPLHFTATATDQVRGVLATCHVFLREPLPEKEIWKIFRNAYGNEPFIRIVREREGLYRLPDPKLLWGTNYCDIGFERDPGSNRLVVISAIDNLVKGAAGQAVQAMNLMAGFDETAGLGFSGLHPV